MIFNIAVLNISDNSFDNLIKNWRGPKPFTIKFEGLLEESSDLYKLISKYQDLGFLK